MKAQLAALLPKEAPTCPAMAHTPPENGNRSKHYFVVESPFVTQRRPRDTEILLEQYGDCGDLQRTESRAHSTYFVVMERQGDVEGWQGSSKGSPEVLEGMVAAVREAGDAAHALQVGVLLCRRKSAFVGSQELKTHLILHNERMPCDAGRPPRLRRPFPSQLQAVVRRTRRVGTLHFHGCIIECLLMHGAATEKFFRWAKRDKDGNMNK